MRRDISEEDAARMRSKPFPIQQGFPIPWELAERAYLYYAERFGSDQSLERLAQRGGFGMQEFACLLARHFPQEGHRECIEKADSLGRAFTTLQAKLKLAEEALEFYAEQGNWCSHPDLSWRSCPADDVERIDCELFAGKRARTALAELRKA